MLIYIQQGFVGIACEHCEPNVYGPDCNKGKIR